ncbi:MAG: hypothetical protein ACREXW_17935 [Gammaproteobacteria bacterium]
MGIINWIESIFTKPDTRKPFVIEVSRKHLAPEVTLKDIESFHPSCGGGLMAAHYEWLRCLRCHSSIKLETGESGIGAVCMTAIDGKERTVHAWLPNDHTYNRVVVRPHGTTS